MARFGPAANRRRVDRDLMDQPACGSRGTRLEALADLEGDMSIDTSNGHPAMDYKEHVRTYDGFIKGAIVLTSLTVLLLLGMLFFLV